MTTFLQELDYVYHDVSAVMTESLMQGADIIALKVRSFLLKLHYQIHVCHALIQVEAGTYRTLITQLVGRALLLDRMQ